MQGHNHSHACLSYAFSFSIQLATYLRQPTFFQNPQNLSKDNMIQVRFGM